VRTLPPPVRERNDPRQYDDLVDEWWAPRGGFAMLHWIAAARATRIPSARPGAVLVDLACGGGLLAPHVHGYRHIGVDLSAPALSLARVHRVTPVRADVLRLPLRDEVADVVVAGEVLEHVTDLEAAVGEACRILKPGGTLVLDTIADTWFGRFSSITVGERIPAGPPKRLHDPALYVDRRRLRDLCAGRGIALEMVGLRPAVTDYLAWLAGRRTEVRMVTTRSTAGLFQGWGTKA
jgi:2-polyprenyl-6-hydroxyphenyl methylase/3-demethylubiquinone-9 3-methyltransferase